MDASAQGTMKDAANCDKRCEWQNSANQENAERILRPQVTPEGISFSERGTPGALAQCRFPNPRRDGVLCVSDACAVDASKCMTTSAFHRFLRSIVSTVHAATCECSGIGGAVCANHMRMKLEKATR